LGKYVLFLLVSIVGFGAVMGQKDPALGDSTTIAREKDLRDVYHELFRQRTLPKPEHIKFHNALFPAAGYTLQTGFAAVITDNMAFYTGDTASSKVSEITSNFTYSQYNQIIIPVLADIWVDSNKYNISTDFRFMKYPSTTFGLGGHSQYSDGYTIDFAYIKLHASLMRQITKNIYVGFGYFYDYFWQIREVNPPKGVRTSFERYGLTPTASGSGPVIRLLIDTRINPVAAYNGWYVSVVYHPSFDALGGSNGTWQSLQVDLRKYFKLQADGRNVLALWQFSWRTLGGKPPYLLLPSTGWDDNFNTGRGYIQGRFRGNDMEYLEAEDRFAISRNGLVGGVVFFNVESFKQNLASTYTNFSPGWGAGLRLKLNKHSGANICIDYGFGLQGSQGVAVNVGEVF
jgi:hypothetical protein